ncbi:hypothetical protein T02_10740 [Trichinella nativa]|uniref:Uncharacterized protein n=1 Tax=Trichinella nativa TaxID=6335 RepID=A0A0V1LP92_9BILA|nr:hypothetical protein T02_10740 [Trichinella nativa]
MKYNININHLMPQKIPKNEFLFLNAYKHETYENTAQLTPLTSMQFINFTAAYTIKSAMLHAHAYSENNHKRISSYCKTTKADHIQISIIALGRRYPLTTIHLLLRHCCSLNSDNDQQREIKFVTLSLQHLDYCYYYLFLGYL